MVRSLVTRVALVMTVAGCGAGAAASDDPPVANPAAPVQSFAPIPTLVAPGTTVPPTVPLTVAVTQDPTPPLQIPPSAEPASTLAAVSDPRVLLVGDSVLEATGDDYYDTMAPRLARLGWEADVDAERGRRTDQAIDVLREAQDKGEIPEVVVLLIGHNGAPRPGLYRAQLEEAMDVLSDVPRVLVLTMREFEPEYAALNSVVRSLDDRHPNVEVVEWDREVRDLEGALIKDGLHLTDVGAEALARVVGRALGPGPLYGLSSTAG